MPTTIAPTVRRNRFAAPCRRCGVSIPAESGSLLRVDGTWVVEHIGDCPERVAAPAPAPGPAAVNVPAGHYATPSRTGNNDLDFWRVDRPTEGRWAGCVFVEEIHVGPSKLAKGYHAEQIARRMRERGIR